MWDEKFAIHKENERIKRSRKGIMDEERLEEIRKKDRLKGAIQKGKVNPKDSQDLLKWEQEDAIKTERRKTNREGKNSYSLDR